MRYALHVPNVGRYADPHLIAGLARTAEDAGWDGFFLWDHLVFSGTRVVPAADPWVSLAAVACATERITLGPLVTPLARRRPWQVARETVTLDHLAGGRTVLGVGLGVPADAEFGAFGEPTGDRVRADMLDEALVVLTELWAGKPVRHHGPHYQVDTVAFEPTPLRGGRIPVWVAGKWPGPRPARRAARWDGIVAMKAGDAFEQTLTPAEVADIVRYVHQHRDATTPFDTVVSATSSWAGVEAPAPMNAYADAGATWWLEVLHPFGREPAEMRALIERGPGVLR